jgi:hypothetical protein
MDGLRVSIRVKGEIDAYPTRRIKLFKEHFESLSLVYRGEQSGFLLGSLRRAPSESALWYGFSGVFPAGKASLDSVNEYRLEAYATLLS